MACMTRELKREYQIYIIAWLAVFLAPLVYLWYVSSVEEYVTFQFSMLLRSWLITLPFLVTFLIHTYFVAPIFIKGKLTKYALFVILLLAAFALYAHVTRDPLQPAPPDVGEIAPGGGPREMGPPGASEMTFSGDSHGIPDGVKGLPPDIPMPTPTEKDAPPEGIMKNGPAPRAGEPGPRGGTEGNKLPHDWPIAPPEWMQFLICVLMLGANLTVKFYLKNLADDRRLRELEKENLARQMEYLRYQIKPHFFMNTLNNIHALVDIEPQKAKDMILELSKLMRYILYDGGKAMVSLDKETEFLNHYISLMKVRYPDRVRINVSLPDALPYMEVPPLVFVTFVENAFKHGVSYDQESFISVSMEASGGKLIFRCTNSRYSSPDPEHSGIGLANAKRRLELLYGQDFTLHVGENPGIYDVLLIIPLSSTHNNNITT